jgi:hypothetical protein
MPAVDRYDQELAKVIAMYVRNGIEEFHCAHLTDAQMKELNPIIRNSIVTALHVFRHMEENEAAKKSFDFNVSLIPKYWENPELLEDYIKFEESYEK